MGLVRRTATGIIVGLVTGLLAGALTGAGGAPAASIAISAVSMGVPLALWGAGYDLLVEARRIRPGGVVEAALYWAVGFPIARVIQELSLYDASATPVYDSPLSFVTFQAMIGMGYGIGFLMLHVQVHLLLRLISRGHRQRS